MSEALQVAKDLLRTMEELNANIKLLINELRAMRITK